MKCPLSKEECECTELNPMCEAHASCLESQPETPDSEKVKRRSSSACSMPDYDEWKKLPPDEAARILSEARGYSAETEGMIAAILEYFPKEKAEASNTNGE